MTRAGQLIPATEFLQLKPLIADFFKELHLLDTGHFALEEEVDRIGSLMHEFLDRTINKK